MRSLLHCSLGLSAIFLAVSSLPSPMLEPKADTSSLDAFYQCKPVANSSCARHFNMREEDAWYAGFPNARGFSLNRSLKEFSDFSWLLHQKNYCSRMLYNLLCFYYFPPCLPQNGPELVARPCYEVCREAADACLPIAQVIRGDTVNIPHHLNCANFEKSRVQDDIRGDSEVTRSAAADSTTVVLACPNASELNYSGQTYCVNKHLVTIWERMPSTNISLFL